MQSDTPSLFLMTGNATVINEAALPTFRKAGPATSRAAGIAVKKRAPSQRMLLLEVFADGAEMTDEQAGIRSGLDAKPNCCYWKRLGELRTLGWLELTGGTAPSRAGERQRLSRITAAGLEALKQAGLAG